MKIAHLLSFHVESFSAFGHDFKESVIKTKCQPEVLLQLLAFGGTAHTTNAQVLSVEDWSDVPEEVMKEIRMVFFTTYRRFVEGRLTPEKDGTYALVSVSTEARVGAGGVFSLPNYSEVQKHAINRRLVKLVG